METQPKFDTDIEYYKKKQIAQAMMFSILIVSDKYSEILFE